MRSRGAAPVAALLQACGAPTWLFLVLCVPALARAQTVTSASGGTLILSVGERAGVQVGMTGKACREETVGGKRVEVCPAGFEVTEVDEGSSTARVTKGDAGAVEVGFRAVFPEVLMRKPAQRPAATPAGCTKDTDCKGDRICQEGRCVNPGPRAPGSATDRVARRAKPPCPAGMALLPAGRYRMGERGDWVAVGRLCMDVTEVTVRAYQGCVRAGGCSRPDGGGACNGDRADRADHPVNCVDHGQAEAYCQWAGRRLPTEEEWEWAARGAERGTTYPWGNEAPASQLCWDGEGNDLVRGQREGTCPVGSYPRGDSPQGVKDLAGNAWEWTDGADDTFRVFRGGGWNDVVPSFVSAANRNRYIPGNRRSRLGFRCARTAQE